MDEKVKELMEEIEELKMINEDLRIKLEKKGNGIGRKIEVEKILRERGKVTIKEISKELGISNKNVSSQLSYLRSDGLDICTDRKGFKFIMD